MMVSVVVVVMLMVDCTIACMHDDDGVRGD
jgi:hypothetical protein